MAVLVPYAPSVLWRRLPWALDRMKTDLRNPNLNAFLLGVLLGVPQGVSLPGDEFLVNPVFDRNTLVVTVFGLIGPPLFVLVGNFLGRPEYEYPMWWKRLEEYLDPNLVVVWASLSIALIGFFALQAARSPGGYHVCALFASVSGGFFVARYANTRLNQKTGNVI